MPTKPIRNRRRPDVPTLRAPFRCGRSIGLEPVRNVVRVHVEFSDVDDSLPEREADKLDIRTYSKLALDQISRISHRLGTYVKSFGDLFRCLFRKQHAQDLELAGR